MTPSQKILTIGIIVLVTMLTRFLPFLIFPVGKKTPTIIRQLGTVLPGAVFSLLVVYCLKNVSLLEGTHGLPEILSIVLVCVLHIWKRKMLLSIAAGTVCYMLLIQFVF